ncbi:MAG TPA: DnaD domain protein [Pseudomonadales bacterium]|nr:DnaD domain protein [Pseudomonadales bacterium]
MLNQKISEDIEFNEMSIEAQFLFMRTVPFLDRDGLINGHPSLLFGKVIPLLPELLPRIPSLVAEWIATGLVEQYMDGKITVLFFSGFAQNQSGMRYDREAESDFAPPPGYSRCNTGLEATGTSTSFDVPDLTDSAEESGVQEDTETKETQSREQGPDLNRTLTGPAPDEIPYKIKINNKINNKTTTAPAEPVVVDCSFVFSLWENNMPGTLTPVIAEEIGDLVDTYGAIEVDTAIRLAVKANKRNVRYVRGILVKRAEGDDNKRLPDMGTAVPLVGVSGELGFSLDAMRGPM